MMDCWDQLSTKAIETIISWFKTTDKNSSIAGITKVIKIIKVETIIRGHAITKAATLPPTQSTMVPTRTVLSTSTMLPSGSMLLTRAVPVASPSSQMTVDVAAGMGSPSFDLLPTINWSFLGFLLLLLSVFILTAACLKSLYDHRHLIAALPGLPLRLFNNIPGNGNRGIGIFVIGDTDFHIDDEDMMMARMSRSARRAMASTSEKAKRAAGKIGRFVPVSSREAKVKVVQCIYHPFFAGMIVGVTVYYVVNNGFPTVQNRASSGGISTEMAYGSYDAQYQERIRPPWFHPLVQLLVTAFTSIKTHWLLTSVLSMLIAVPYVAMGVINWHDDLPQERRNEVNQHVDSVRIWFLTIDWPKHRETLVGMGVRCYSGVSTALVKIGDCLSWCSPWLTRACSKLWMRIKWVCRGAWWLLKLFVGGIGTGIFWLINSWESRKLPEVQKELAEYRASQKKNAEKKDREHTTELTKLKTQLKSKDQQITGLDYTNLQLNRSWTVAVNARIQDAQGYNTQLDRAERYSDLDSQHGTNVAKETGAKYRKLLKVHTEQQKEHERDVELFSQHFTELQGKLDQQRTAFCSEYTQQITDLQSSVSTMSATMKTKFNELEASSTRAGDLERDLRIERAQKEALREDFSNQYFQLSKSFDDFKSLHQSC
ncbi:MAG: hypothetical protein L6R42_008411, partial [Xanthoria sp. 1 TBL-2021]